MFFKVEIGSTILRHATISHSQLYNQMQELPLRWLGCLDGNEVNARFLQRIRDSTGKKKPAFAFKKNDKGSFPRSDVLKKLPQPQRVGGTARREQQFIFPCNLDELNVE